MPRVARVDVANYSYHVINRAVMRLRIFTTDEDYLLFEKILEETVQETQMRLIAYTLMPNHWHLLPYPRTDGDLAVFMHRLTNKHTRKVKSLTNTAGTGPLYQGRYKSFIIQDDPHFLTVVKYIERNPVRARLSARAEDWRWGSAWRRAHGTLKQKKLLASPPVSFPRGYLSWINTPESTKELDGIRTSVNKGAPYGNESWVEKVVEEFNLGATLRNPGRPKTIQVL